jgi:hypothetical protein
LPANNVYTVVSSKKTISDKRDLKAAGRKRQEEKGLWCLLVDSVSDLPIDKESAGATY